jgi:formate hydrogenlyase transcriptional activator
MEKCCSFVQRTSSNLRGLLKNKAMLTPRDSSILQPNHANLQAGQVEKFLRFMNGLSSYADSGDLLRRIPTELHELFSPKVTILVCHTENGLACYAVDDNGIQILDPPSISAWYEEVQDSWLQQSRVVSLLDNDSRLPETATFFRGRGNHSLCLLPLNTGSHRCGLLCIGRDHQDGFPEQELSFLSLIAGPIALAIDDWLNLANSEAMRAQLESERKKLKLILDLNNSVISNLDLREVLQSISPSIRKVLCLDGVVLMLPDAEAKNLHTHALDFPDGKGVMQQDMSSPLDTSLPGRVFRSGQYWVGDIHELRRSGFDDQIATAEGVETLCLLPLIRCKRVLGVLCLVRLERNAFTHEDIEFLSQIAGQVAIAIDNALAYRKITELSDKLTQEKLYLEDEIRSEMNFEEIVGDSAVLKQVLRQVEAVAPTESAVLIYGETGTGKELIARAVHKLSQRYSNAFVKLNCAAIPTGLLESELFGHEKGAFTGAIAQRTGRFELASQGTIFLDEVGEIPLELQPKLLRVLQEREFERLGSSRTLRTNARLIAATNRDLRVMVDEQRFRSDLFYRLNVFPIQVPPLRERPEDIPFLVRHFAQHFARNMKKQIDTISSETMNALVHYSWPGNIRELQNIIERAVILSKGSTLKVPLSDLKPRTSERGHMDGATTLEEVERRHILAVLEQSHWVVSGPNGAAARLGIKRPTLQFRMQKLGISRPQKD